MSDKKWEPWVDYPELWPSKAKFYTYLRGALRKALWNTSPVKIIFKNENCSKPPEGYNGRAKSGAYCVLSGEWEGKSALQVDHIVGNVSLQEEEDILGFIQHLIPPPNSLALVTKAAHKIKSYAEKEGISYEQAVVTKTAIEICKTKKDKQWLEERGITPSKNAKQRRQQIEDYLTELNT